MVKPFFSSLQNPVQGCSENCNIVSDNAVSVVPKFGTIMCKMTSFIITKSGTLICYHACVCFFVSP